MGDGGWWDQAERDRAWWHPLIKRYVTNGPVPQHVAFVMDGNRRFARTKGLGSVLNGHEKGFEQLAKILEWCNDMGVHEVTVYAFSIENFKRTEDEVSGLMKLAEEKFRRLLDEREKLEERQICFRFHGNISLLSAELRKLIAQIQLTTSGYTRGYVNVCMPYTSRDEMARAFEWIRQGTKKGLLHEDQIDEWLVERCLDTHLSKTPDMLIRTSGEKRLSDFLLWQCSTSHVYFADVLWPEFDYWHLCKAILSYQYHHKHIQEIANEQNVRSPSLDELNKLAPFFTWMTSSRKEILTEFACVEC